MRLNADILYENLKQTMPAELSGFHTGELNLRRPEFYVDSGEPMKTGHLYLLPGGQFPRRVKMEPGCVLLCTGTPPLIQQYLDRCCLITVREKVDPFALMNTVTAIFDRYSAWYEQLHQIVETTADLTEMTELTARLFVNPVMVLDSEFRFVTTAGYDTPERRSIAFDETGSDKLSLSAMNQFLSQMDMQLDRTDPLHIDILGHSVLSYNLFDMEEYAGSLTIEYRNRPYMAGDEPLIRLFAHYLMLAMKQHTEYLSSTHSTLRKVFQNLLEDMPLGADHRRRLEQMDVEGPWKCILLHPGQRLSKVPMSYVCDQVEALYPGGVAFPYHGNIVVFLEAEDPADGKERNEAFLRLLTEQFDADSLKVGVSSNFADLSTARIYYTQASTALENGSIFTPEETFYFFQDYALEELIINAPGDQPLELYYSDGLKRLFEHDASSATSYVETLQVYLNNNMNVTATAQELYIHRSTLLERLSRIRKELWDDLEDPDVRLRLQIVLKALDIRARASKKEAP